MPTPSMTDSCSTPDETVRAADDQPKPDTELQYHDAGALARFQTAKQTYQKERVVSFGGVPVGHEFDEARMVRA